MSIIFRRSIHGIAYNAAGDATLSLLIAKRGTLDELDAWKKGIELHEYMIPQGNEETFDGIIVQDQATLGGKEAGAPVWVDECGKIPDLLKPMSPQRILAFAAARQQRAIAAVVKIGRQLSQVEVLKNQAYWGARSDLVTINEAACDLGKLESLAANLERIIEESRSAAPAGADCG